MKLYSTRRNSPVVSFREALFTGQAPDGGLYIPCELPTMTPESLAAFTDKPYKEMAHYILQQIVGDEFGSGGLQTVIDRAYSFAPAISTLSENLAVLELFHGPTLSFKDFGAQFMAKAMGYFLQNEDREITILVATSGDTGSAVAHAYHKVQGIRIVLLYPSGKVSLTQEMQFTSLGDNITALEVDGTFDDCQALVKAAFRDRELRQRARLSSANSINIGRLIPQSLYYFWGAAKLKAMHGVDPLICVPSGNFGNICAGMLANRMGAPAARFIAAVNANAAISEYVQTGEYKPRPSVRTLSNAMDVGRPSNWERIVDMFDNDYDKIVERMWSTSVSDKATVAAMKRIYNQFSYVADPHTCVGLEAVRRYRQNQAPQQPPALTLSTAHPGKFHEIVEKTLGITVELPQALQECLKRKKQAQSMANDFDQFKELLWELT